jgi:hypothetical protein
MLAQSVLAISLHLISTPLGASRVDNRKSTLTLAWNCPTDIILTLQLRASLIIMDLLTHAPKFKLNLLI